MSEEQLSLRTKLDYVWRALVYRPLFAGTILCLSFLTAVLEGIGISFLLPIIGRARGEASDSGGGAIMDAFLQTYDLIGVPLTLETAIVGVSVVMTVRYSATFLTTWMKLRLQIDYTRHLQERAYYGTLSAKVGYFDGKGSDELLNTLITETKQAGKVVGYTIDAFQRLSIALIYVAVAVILAPVLSTVAAVIVLAALVVVRYLFESAYTIGDRVAEGNEQVHTFAQTGIQGIREVKLFNLGETMSDAFEDAIDKRVRSQVRLGRNNSAMNNMYRLLIAVAVFVLIYLALALANLSIEELGLFLFAIFRMAPRVSQLNTIVYNVDSRIAHIRRTHEFLADLAEHRETDEGERPVPDPVESVAFEDVSFSYNDEERILDGITFRVDRGEFVAFVGSSGAGKSTIVSLLGRLYEPDAGRITADGIPIDEFPLAEWRESVAVVRQNPYLFSDTLRYNLTVGNPDATQEEIERICEIARVDEFLDTLPNGYDTHIGDDGVRLSGGQRQRVALARALLKDADVLVLDEATSDLDNTIEEEVHNGIIAMDQDFILIVVAHRLSTVRGTDRIYAMEDGRTAETGPHSELLEQGGMYADLYHRT